MSSTPFAYSHPAGFRRFVPWALAVLPFVVLLGWFWTSGDGPDLDDPAIYLLNAQALLDGRPYGQTSYIDSRYVFSPAVPPPGLPVTLAAVMAATGGYNEVVIKIAMVLLALPFFLLPGLYFARSHGIVVGTAVTLFLSVGQAWTSMRVLSDLAFASIVWGLIWALDYPGGFGRRRVAGVFLLGSMALAYRFVGAAVVPAVALFALFNYRRLGVRPAIPALVWIGGALVGLTVTGRWMATLRPIGLGDAGFLDFLLGRLRTSFLVPAAEAHLTLFASNAANDAFHIVSLTIAGVALLRWTSMNWRSGAVLIAVGYLSALASTWAQDARYLLPLYPFLIFGLFNGIQLGIGRLRRTWSPLLVSRATLLVACAIVSIGFVRIVLEPRPIDMARDPDTASILEYVRSLSEGDARIMTQRPRTIAWQTGVPTVDVIVRSPSLTLEELDRIKVTHIMVDESRGTRRRRASVMSLVAEYPCRFEVVVRNDSYTVYRMERACPG